MNVQQQVILDNYHHPQNFGKPAQFTNHLRLENFTCGDAIDIYLNVVDDKVIDASFDGEGCSISIASASLLTEELKGKTIGAVLEMTIDDIMELLGIELTPSAVAVLSYLWKQPKKLSARILRQSSTFTRIRIDGRR